MIIIFGYCYNNNKVAPIYSATYDLSGPTVTFCTKCTNDINTVAGDKLSGEQKWRERERECVRYEGKNRNIFILLAKKTRSTFRCKSARSYSIVFVLSLNNIDISIIFLPFSRIYVVLVVMNGLYLTRM